MKFEVRNGNFGYDKDNKILKDINISISGNSILSILGPNGVGKTTLVKCMLGLLKWSGGETYLDDKPVSKMKHKEFWRMMGYVPQAKLSAFAYTVEEMVLLGRNTHLKEMELPGEKDYKIANECLEYVGISHLKHKLCSKISGGELQMVLIARALTAEPKMLILDEPESNLDFRNQLIVLNTIKELSKEKNIPAVVNTHYPSHALSISEQALVLARDRYLYGDAKKIITEQSMESAFGVYVKIADIKTDKGLHTCVLPVALT